jgi:hypothetical protein
MKGIVTNINALKRPKYMENRRKIDGKNKLRRQPHKKLVDSRRMRFDSYNML